MKAADPFAISRSKEEEWLAHQKAVELRAEKDILAPERICQHMLHDLLFTASKDRLEKFEGKEKAGCDLFENAAGLS